MAKICQLHADLKYFLCMQPVDMRKQFQGLQGIVNEEFGRYLSKPPIQRKVAWNLDNTFAAIILKR